MKKILLLLQLLVLTIIVNAQVIIPLSDPNPEIPSLTNKKLKSTADYTISDNTIDFKSISRFGYSVTFTGTYAKPLNIKNLKGASPTDKVHVIHNTTRVTTNYSSFTLKFTDCKNIDLDGLNSTKLLASGVNNAGNMIGFDGRWQNIDIHGFYIDQNRNSAGTSTGGGAMIQLHGVADPTFNHGDIRVWDIDGRNANDEFLYVLLYYSSGASRAKSLEVWHTKIKNSGRDFWQATNIDSVYFHDNEGDNGALEQNGDHISVFSLNDGLKYVKLENNKATNIPQYFYSGSTNGLIETLNNTYVQGTSTYINNQSIYTKSPTILHFDSITAPKVKIAAIAQDKAQVTYQGLTVVAPKLFRYTTPVPVELPVVKTYPETVLIEETILSGATTSKVLIYNGVRIKIQ